PWSGGGVETVEDAVRVAGELGFPLMIKAAAGGGGRGMRRVESADEVAHAFERARAEAEQAFGDPSVLMERLGCATAATSAATRRSSRNPPRRRSARSRSASWPRRPCGSRARRATAGRARS